MLDYMKNLFEVNKLRKNICYIKNDVMYAKWAFPTAAGGWNPTYTPKVSKKILEEILKETENYKTTLKTKQKGLAQKYPTFLENEEEVIVYGLSSNIPFKTENQLVFKPVKNAQELTIWAKLARAIYPKYDIDFLMASFQRDIRKQYATYFIGYYNKKPIAISQVIRDGGVSAVYWVGVLKEYRNKGIGREQTLKTLNYEIKNGHNKFILTASELGLKIYKKIGFKPVEKFYNYDFKYETLL